jgi:nuclear transport factor 2 (NTF2) superfamily protein
LGLAYLLADVVAVDDEIVACHWPLGRRPDDHPSLSDLGL